MNPASELRKAANFSQAGQHAEAALVYQQVLAKFPLREDANRGLLAALEASARWDELEALATRLTEKLPQFVPAWLSLARALLVRNKDALAACQRGIKLDPKNPGAHDFLGVALRRAGRLDEAATALHASLGLRPNSLSTQANLANVLREAGHLSEAIRRYRQVLAADPERLDVAYNHSLALSDLGLLREAEQQLREILAKAPGFAEAHSALGSALQAMKRMAEAETAFKTALSLKPDLPETVFNLILALHNLGKLTEMAERLAEAGDLLPSNAMVRLARLVVALPKVVNDKQEADARLAQFDAGLEAYAHWRTQGLADGSLRHDTLANLPFFLAYRPGNQKDRLSRFSDVTSQGKRWPRVVLEPTKHALHEPIRLGIVSAHIRRHSVWDIVLKGLVTHLDPALFELTIYHLGPIEDAETQFARAAVPHWRDAGALAASTGWAALIAGDQQDVLYYPELGMDPTVYMLAQQRLAPLQAAGWGHPITTGIAAIDLFFSGELLEPPDGQQHYREQLIKLPNTGCCTTAYDLEALPCPAFDALLTAGAPPVFLIPQSVVKFDPEFDPVLVEIARRVGACHFVIPVGDEMKEPGEQLAARLARAFGQAGLAAADFIVFVPWLSEGQFKQALQRCTVFLDCPSFSGYTTAWKALREGIPVLTLEGPFMRQRLAAGLLRKIGLHDLVVTSEAAYIDQAVLLATEPAAAQAARRQAVSSAAAAADNDVSVVRAFERELLARVAKA